MEQEKKAEAAPVSINSGGGQIHVDGDIVGRDKNVYEAPAVPIPALHQLRPPPRDFTGREKEIAELLAAVEKGGVTISGLQGLGGVGKTALALKLAERLTPSYPDAQFDLDLKGVSANPLSAKQAMEHVIRAYHPTAKLPENETELAGLYQSVLRGKRAILFLDNARDAKQIEPLIPPPTCLLLVTSRQRFALPGLLEKNLEALPPADARDLLLGIARRLVTETEDYADELVRLCAYLPLAIRSIGSALAARIDLKPADYVQKLSDARERLRLTETDASLSLSYDLLAAELQGRFLSLAVFPDTFDAVGAAAVWDVERDPAQDSLSELGLYSLVEFNSASTRYRLHDLVRAFADSRLDPTDQMVSQKRHAQHFKNVLAFADHLYRQGNESLKNGLLLFDTEWTNIQSGHAWAAEHASLHDEAARLCSGYPEASNCLGLRQDPRELIKWIEAALVAARNLKDRGAESRHLGNLGVAYSSLAEYRRGIECFEQSLEIAREMGEQHVEGNALGNLGNAYYSLGEYRRTIECQEKALQIERKIGDRGGEGITLGNLGVAYLSLAEYRRAIECYEQSLEIAREMGEWDAEGNALGNIGNAYGNLGDYRRAIDYFEQTLQIKKKLGDRRGQGTTLGNLGVAYKNLGEHLRATEHHEQYLQIAREIGDRSGEATAHWNMSLALEKLGEGAEAIAHAEDALRIFEQIESPHVARVRRKLATWRGEGEQENP